MTQATAKSLLAENLKRKKRAMELDDEVYTVPDRSPDSSGEYDELATMLSQINTT